MYAHTQERQGSLSSGTATTGGNYSSTRVTMTESGTVITREAICAWSCSAGDRGNLVSDLCGGLLHLFILFGFKQLST